MTTLKTSGSIEPTYEYTAKVLFKGINEEVEYQGTSVQKIAEKMNISNTTVRKILKNEKTKYPFIESISITRVPI